MKFGLFYEHQVPRPWSPEAERRVLLDALEQVALADTLGLEYVWEVEHHFLEEYSHSSAPEVFLAAASQRTTRIRLGHGISLMPPKYNHPARVAERIATLDLLSGGRVEWGTGESATALEMLGFGIDPREKEAMWEEAAEQAANMLAMTPYPGFKGQYFEMPCRNVVPKSYQQPHPPMWVACSRRETIHRAARLGLGALAFAFVEPEQARTWVQEYYDIITSEHCVPLGHTVNPNMAVVSGFSLHRESEEAMRRGLDGFRFFGYSLGHVAIFGQHRPGRTDLWQHFLEIKDTLPNNAGSGGIGNPAQVREHLERYERAGIDQVIFVQQCGNNQHEHICESLELFAKALHPEFKRRDDIRAAQKREELAPYIAAALQRKKRLAPVAEEDIPTVEAFGRHLDGGPQADATRGGAIPVVTHNPHAAKPRQVAGA
jgi:alkanesulfonate monooxygenase SsuD/methylene tetrahydromethanopterin reductase-like flavin-dependent oxidoreductase (luciferase family)